MGHFISKSHNKSMLIYHLVCTIKYRRDVLTKEVTNSLVNICMNIQENSDIEFIEIGTDINHVHFLFQATPSYSISQYVKLIKGKIGNNIFKTNPEIKNKLWGGEFWGGGYWIVTVSQHVTEDVIREYVREQGKNKYDLLFKRDEGFYTCE